MSLTCRKILLFVSAGLVFLHWSLKAIAGGEVASIGGVFEVTIEVASAEADYLRKHPRTYVAASVSFVGESVTNAGLRLKGKSTFQAFDDRPSLTIDVDRFVPAETLRGRRKLHLHNCVLDPSLLREYVAYAVFREMDVPAPQVGHARVRLNGQDLGWYAVVEGTDERFVAEWFGSKGGTVYERNEVDLGETLHQRASSEPSRIALTRLVEATKVTNPTARWDALQSALDLDRYLAFCAVEVLVGQNDGYLNNLNNFRLHLDSADGRVTFTPWGLDRCFGNPLMPLRPSARLRLAAAVFHTPAGREGFYAKLRIACDVLRSTNLLQRIESTESLLLARTPDPAERARLAEAIREFRHTVAEREANVTRRLPEYPLKPVEFAEGVSAPLSEWETYGVKAGAVAEKITVDGTPCLRLAVNRGLHEFGWRTWVFLDEGEYRVVGRVRTKEAGAPRFSFPSGACIHCWETKWSPFLTGDTEWTTYEHPITVEAGGAELEIWCHLLATRGEALFDGSSLRIVRVNGGAEQ
jgi:hypothetical protein